MTGGAILIIEDNEDLRDEIVDYLCRRGHAASGCKTLAEAHDFCREHHPATIESSKLRRARRPGSSKRQKSL